jgi:hypothetical protein
VNRIIFILIFIGFLLASCGPTPSATAFDPNLSAIQQQMTAQAAENQAQLYSAMATGTAQAPILAITQTAAAQQVQFTGTAEALAYQQQMWTMTAQSVQSTETAAMTGTAMAWTPTSNATMTMVFAQSYADATRVANEIAINNLEVERARNTNAAKMVITYGAAIVFMILVVAGYYQFLRMKAFIPHTVDERGKVIPMINVIEGTAFDIEKSANGMIGTGTKFLAQLPKITAERQDPIVARAQMTDMATRAKLPLRLLRELQNPDAPTLGESAKDVQPILIDYPLPEWNAWMQNWKPGQLALGINEKGLLQVDPDLNPHLLFAGTTGSWKTRGGVRVAVTCALASGWQVIIAGKELDYKVFENHPNAYLVPFSLLKEPTRAIDLLRSVYGEIERRDRMMVRSNYSLWKETGESRTMVVMDEFSNLADALEDIDRSRREELWRWARMDTAEARKYGVHMVYALQDPTAQSINLRIRRNTTPIMFRVKDAASSRTLLNVSGAEMLSARHFLANIIKIERGASFAPSDDEIREFLNSHPVRTAEEPAWVEGVLVSQPSLPEAGQDVIEGPAEVTNQKPADEFARWVMSLTDKPARIVELYQAGGFSQADIEESVYGYRGGAAARAVSSVIKKYRELKNIPTTTTTTTEISPDLSPAAA